MPSTLPAKSNAPAQKTAATTPDMTRDPDAQPGNSTKGAKMDQDWGQDLGPRLGPNQEIRAGGLATEDLSVRGAHRRSTSSHSRLLERHLRRSMSARYFLRKASMLTTFGPALASGSGALGTASLAGALPAAGGRSPPFSDARRGPRDFFSARPPSGVELALEASPARAPARGASPRGAASCCAPSLSASISSNCRPYGTLGSKNTLMAAKGTTNRSGMLSNVNLTSKRSSVTTRSQKRCCRTTVISSGYFSRSRFESTTPGASVLKAM